MAAPSPAAQVVLSFPGCDMTHSGFLLPLCAGLPLPYDSPGCVPALARLSPPSAGAPSLPPVSPLGRTAPPRHEEARAAAPPLVPPRASPSSALPRPLRVDVPSLRADASVVAGAKVAEPLTPGAPTPAERARVPKKEKPRGQSTGGGSARRLVRGSPWHLLLRTWGEVLACENPVSSGTTPEQGKEVEFLWRGERNQHLLSTCWSNKFITLGRFLGVECWIICRSVFSVLWNLHTAAHSGWTSLHSHQRCQRLLSLRCFSSICCSQFFFFNVEHSHWSEVVAHCGFDLHFPDTSDGECFFYACWPFVFLLWRSVFLPLPIFWTGLLVFVESCKLFVDL
ncbi:uncharacterized protein LOC129145407 [Talpa occidentalis]|uniref:uncharacterized protein LOC129145407 n=1 Tax=Talpa occidentalis TaxID=50954 RepID=UPI0023FA071F|nr:uncharacterized protein LOC129145407 [Talpa occidentalis]